MEIIPKQGNLFLRNASPYREGFVIMSPLSFTMAQASVLTGLKLKALNKAIDRKSIPVRKVRTGQTTRRYVDKVALLCLRLQAEGLRQLPLHLRKKIFQKLVECPSAREIRFNHALIVDVRRAREGLAVSLKNLRKAEEMVVSDQDILGGIPVFRGTRVPVYLIADMVNRGIGVAEILDGYPSLTKEQVCLSVVYARANPKRGRPLASPLQEGRVLDRTSRPLARREAVA